jgi:cell wall-associated NlpC family hydrolase
MPEGKPLDGKAWMKRFSIQDIETGASLVATKVNLTDLQEYDVILFKSGRLLPTHFGMYVGYNKFIHLEEGRFSKIDNLNDAWRGIIASIWRQTGINT